MKFRTPLLALILPVGSSRRRSTAITVVLAAVFLLPSSGSAQEGPYLRTATAAQYTLGREKFETATTSLADAITDPYSSASVSVHYGSATASARLNAPTNSQEDLCHVDGYWQDEITVNNPALTGEQGIARFTVHVSGGLSGSWSGDAANGVVQYGALVGDFFATGNISRNGRMDQVPTISTVDVPFTYGVPSPTPRFLLTVQVDGSGGFDGHEGSAVESVDYTLRSAGFVVVNNLNQPQSFTSESRTGSSRGTDIAPGGSFSGFTLTNGTPGRVGTSLSLLGGTAGAAENVTAAFVAPPPPAEIQLVSDAVEVAGTGTDLFVIQLNYDPILAQALSFAESTLRLGWFEPITKNWVNAVAGNLGGTPKFLARAYNAALDLHLGSFGLDTVNHVVWAVVNHNSEFGVSVLPDTVLMKVESITHPAINTMRLRGVGVPNATTRIESSPNLSPNSFTTLTSVTTDATGTFQFDDINPGTTKFYRLAFP